jgi:hypothetical protein
MSKFTAEELGPAARTASGDLSNVAIAHAYSEMGAAVRKSFQTHRAVLKMQINKSDRNDAAGIARIVQTGWFKAVRVKDLDSPLG